MFFSHICRIPNIRIPHTFLNFILSWKCTTPGADAVKEGLAEVPDTVGCRVSVGVGWKCVQCLGIQDNQSSTKDRQKNRYQVVSGTECCIPSDNEGILGVQKGCQLLNVCVRWFPHNIKNPKFILKQQSTEVLLRKDTVCHCQTTLWVNWLHKIKIIS